MSPKHLSSIIDLCYKAYTELKLTHGETSKLAREQFKRKKMR